MASPFTTQSHLVADAPIEIAPATEPQLTLLRDLMVQKAERVHGAANTDDFAKIDHWLASGVSKAQASENITRLLDEARNAPAPAPVASFMAEAVPAGRYAIDTMIHAVNGTAFYKVDRPTEGRWVGRVFVRQIIGPDEQKLSQKQGGVIIRRIAEAGAEAAAARYGQEIGECGMCGRTLTNDESRARGIGPICAAKAGW